MAQRIVTPEARFSYPFLFEARENMSGDKKQFSVQLMWPKTQDLSDLRKAAVEAVKEKWGADKAKWPGILKTQNLAQYLSTTGQDGWPFRDGDAMGKPETEGMVVLTVKSNEDRRPKVVDHNVQPVIDPADIYGGCYGRVSIMPFAYDANGKKGVSFGLGNVQKTKDGESFGAGAVKPEDEFGPVATGEEEEF